MTNVILFSAVFLCGMIFASGAPVSIECKKPTDLKVRYEKLIAETIGNKFLLPAEYTSTATNHTLVQGETTCPKTLPTASDTQHRSTCPWYTKIITDSTLFPPVRSEAVCRCSDCIGSNGIHNCERVYSEMLFLQRTSICIDGLLVYEPIIKYITTGCVCAQKVIKSHSTTGYGTYNEHT
nr:interleukin 17-12 [Sepiella japonica]